MQTGLCSSHTKMGDPAADTVMLVRCPRAEGSRGIGVHKTRKGKQQVIPEKRSCRLFAILVQAPSLGCDNAAVALRNGDLLWLVHLGKLVANKVSSILFP